MKKAIERVLIDGVVPIKYGEAHYNINWRPFEGKVKELNEMGAPITMQDLADLIEYKLSGKPGDVDLRFPCYTLICKIEK